MTNFEQEARTILEKVKDFGISITRDKKYPYTSKENLLTPNQAFPDLLRLIEKELPKERKVVVSEYKGKPIIMDKKRQIEFEESLGTLIGFNQALTQVRERLGIK